MNWSRARKQKSYPGRIAGNMTRMIIVIAAILGQQVVVCAASPVVNFTVSFADPASGRYHVVMECSGWDKDTATFKMPAWMPGYYQLMHYAKDLEGMTAQAKGGIALSPVALNEQSWRVAGIRNKTFAISYDIQTRRNFVASSFVDSNHAYLIPEASFLYPEGHLDIPVRVTILPAPAWTRIATGLDSVAGKPGVFTATDYDILYDCPILAGPLEELPSFTIRGIKHRFIGYRMGDFDRGLFMDQLKKVVTAGIDIIGDIPYKQYTFIAIGPGRGGIEHLNNTTVSFDGSRLGTPAAMNGIMNFLAHEYFHHYNVKRIRPFELGPFDYDRGSRTNLLWVSEGLSVYYEHLMVQRAGLTDESGALAAFERHLNQVENNPGRHFQSLVQASYNTWSDGPFGTGGDEPGKTISYYEKGPLVGLLLDFAIRQATNNDHSLDDVMRLLYHKYYKDAGRGFTDAEFQQACESIAGTSLATLFEYVYTTKDLDYNRWLNPGGLQVTEAPGEGAKTLYTIRRVDNPDASQQKMLESWLGGGR